MKLKALLIIFCTICFFSCSQKGQSDNNLKEIYYSTWQYKDSELKQMDIMPFLTYSEFYNSKNQLIKKTNYMKDTIFGYTIYDYKNGMKVLETSYDKKNKITTIDSLIYDSKNRLISENISNLKSDKKLRFSYQYNEDDQLILKQFINNSGEVEDYWKYTYDRNEKTEEYYHLGKLATRTITNYNSEQIEQEKKIEKFKNEKLRSNSLIKFGNDGLESEIIITNLEESKSDTIRFEYEIPEDGSIDWTKKKSLKNGNLTMEYRKTVKYSS